MNIAERERPELPDNATLEQQEEHEAKIIKTREERIQGIADYIEKKSNERKAELDKIEDMNQIKAMYKTSIVNIRCEEEFTKMFREYQIYKGTYRDEALTELAFDSFEEFLDSAPQLKTTLMSAYVNLELTGEDLKN
jgi:hypothetical protein